MISQSHFSKSFLITLLFIISLFIYNCIGVSDKDGLLRYISSSKHGLSKTVSYQDNSITAVYKPQVLIALTEIIANDKISNKAFTDSIIDYYSKFLYFSISFSNNGTELLNSFLASEKLYSSAIEYLAFSIQEKSMLITDRGDTLRAIGSTFPRLYGSTNNNEVLLVFGNKIGNSKEFLLHIDANDIINARLEFNYRIKDISKIPELKL